MLDISEPIKWLFVLSGYFTVFHITLRPFIFFTVVERTIRKKNPNSPPPSVACQADEKGVDLQWRTPHGELPCLL